LALTTSPEPTKVSKRPKIMWRDMRENLTGCLFVFPAFLLIFVFGLFPIGFSVYVSLHKWRINPGDFNGLDNYTKALGNLAYVAFFWVAAILIFLAVRSFRVLVRMAKEREETPWLWAIPALVTTLGIAGFLRFIVLLLPEILGIAMKVRGMVRTQDLFVQLLGEAWRTPTVQAALQLSLLILAFGWILFYLTNRYLPKSLKSTKYFTSWILIFIFLGCGAIYLC